MFDMQIGLTNWRIIRTFAKINSIRQLADEIRKVP